MTSAASTVSVLVLAAGCAAGVRDEPDGAGSPRPGGPPEVVESPTGPSSEGGPWRTERWRGVEVRVPATWGVGTAPIGDGRRRFLCGPVPDGRPYVGRPILASDACVVTDDEVPEAPSVWLGVDLEPGTTDPGRGWVRETVRAEGTTVTVISRDDRLRADVLGSVTPVTLCAASLGHPPDAVREWTREGPGALVSASLCAYRLDDRRYRLVHGGELRPRVAAATFRAATRTPRRTRVCGDQRPHELVTVTGRYRDPYGDHPGAASLTRRVVYRFGVRSGVCAVRGVAPPGSSGRVTSATVRPWAGPRFRHLLTGPYEPWAYRFFVGVQG